MEALMTPISCGRAWASYGDLSIFNGQAHQMDQQSGLRSEPYHMYAMQNQFHKVGTDLHHDEAF